MIKRINKYFLFCLLLLLCCLKASPCNAEDEEEEDEEERPRTCQKYLYDFVQKTLTSLLKCLAGQSSFKVHNIFEYATKSSCLLKCVLQIQGLIADDGSLDDIGSAFYFEENFAQPVKDISLPLAQACFALADKFNPNDYWCQSYLPFVECAFSAILKGLIPYGGDCVTYPALGILFSVIKYLAPESPKVSEEMEELRRSVESKNHIKCLDQNCTRLYEYKKVNGTKSIILYNKDMEVVSIESRQSKAKANNNNPKGSTYSKINNNNFNNNYNNYNNYYNRYR